MLNLDFQLPTVVGISMYNQFLTVLHMLPYKQLNFSIMDISVMRMMKYIVQEMSVLANFLPTEKHL